MISQFPFTMTSLLSVAKGCHHARCLGYRMAPCCGRDGADSSRGDARTVAAALRESRDSSGGGAGGCEWKLWCQQLASKECFSPIALARVRRVLLFWVLNSWSCWMKDLCSGPSNPPERKGRAGQTIEFFSIQSISLESKNAIWGLFWCKFGRMSVKRL